MPIDSTALGSNLVIDSTVYLPGKFTGSSSELPYRKIFNIEIFDEEGEKHESLENLETSGPFQLTGVVLRSELSDVAKRRYKGSEIRVRVPMISEWAHEFGEKDPVNSIMWVLSHQTCWYQVESVAPAYKHIWEKLTNKCAYFDALKTVLYDEGQEDLPTTVFRRMATLMRLPIETVESKVEEYRNQIVKMIEPDMEETLFYPQWILDGKAKEEAREAEQAESRSNPSLPYSADSQNNRSRSRSFLTRVDSTATSIAISSQRSTNSVLTQTILTGHGTEEHSSSRRARSGSLDSVNSDMYDGEQYENSDYSEMEEGENDEVVATEEMEEHDRIKDLCPAPSSYPCPTPLCPIHSRKDRPENNADKDIEIKPLLLKKFPTNPGDLDRSAPMEFQCPLSACFFVQSNALCSKHSGFIEQIAQHIYGHKMEQKEWEATLRYLGSSNQKKKDSKPRISAQATRLFWQLETKKLQLHKSTPTLPMPSTTKHMYEIAKDWPKSRANDEALTAQSRLNQTEGSQGRRVAERHGATTSTKFKSTPMTRTASDLEHEALVRLCGAGDAATIPSFEKRTANRYSSPRVISSVDSESTLNKLAFTAGPLASKETTHDIPSAGSSSNSGNMRRTTAHSPPLELTKGRGGGGGRHAGTESDSAETDEEPRMMASRPAPRNKRRRLMSTESPPAPDDVPPAMKN